MGAQDKLDAATKKYNEAHKHAQEENAVQALKGAQDTLAKANKFSKEKALSASVAGRDAEEAQMALEKATTQLHEAQEAVKAAKALKDLLWDVYDAIEFFYRAISDLTRAVRRSEDDCEGPAHECLITNTRDATETVLKRYNSMVLSFMTIKELHASVYTELKPAGDELETNAMAQIKLSCDPIMELEKAGDAADFDKKCGDGLWEAVGLVKNRFF